MIRLLSRGSKFLLASSTLTTSSLSDLHNAQPSINSSQAFSLILNRPYSTSSPNPSGSSIKMSPAAHHMVDALHLDATKLTATGPRGLILKEDVLQFVESGHKSPPVSEKPKTNEPTKISQPKPVSSSTVKVPRFSVTCYINLEHILKIQNPDNLKAFLIKIAASSCQKVPEVNSKFFPEFTRFYPYVDVQAFLYGKTMQNYFIQDCQSKRVEDIKELMKKESNGRYNFAISFGDSNEIVTPDASALLGLGSEEKIVVKDGETFKVNRMIKATLNCDHRAIDGAVGANWLQVFKRFAEDPISAL